MRSFTKVFGASVVCASCFAFMFAVSAAESPRAAMGRASTSARMPTMPATTVEPADIVTNNGGNVVPEPEPQPEPDPDPKPECDDGGVRNSEYSVSECMNDVLRCVNNGALAGGLNDLFNEDMRNAIVNGMGLCAVQVDKCVTTVRRDCKPVYLSTADVWIDFNSRKVQPEYYTFVLRKTGLTPNQAENTCLLLDRNTYGPSFSSVAVNDMTSAEYNKQVGAYNGKMGNVLVKTNPMGPTVNSGHASVDGERGHYARWDATTATCYLRVAAYNKDEQIKNSWLFGALGDDKMAEVWRPAGDMFTCNKDLFGFSLMNDTSTAAVVGVGGGTLLGTGIGAIAGHGNRAFDCDNASAMRELNKQIHANKSEMYVLNAYISDAITTEDLTKSQCEEIVNLYTEYNTVEQANPNCFGKRSLDCAFVSDSEDVVFEKYIQDDMTDQCIAADKYDSTECVSFIASLYPEYSIDGTKSYCKEGKVGCDITSLRNSSSLFGRLKCQRVDGGCTNSEQLQAELEDLRGVFGKLSVLGGEKSNMGKSIGTGAAIGAGTGGVATAITAFVERNNINCRVGDGLNKVAFGKSHSIDTLKDFYVKWNLRLPDTVSPTATVIDCATWKSACGQYTDMNQCNNVAVNYKPKSGSTTLVRSACVASGSVCIENDAVAKSYGACE